MQGMYTFERALAALSQHTGSVNQYRNRLRAPIMDPPSHICIGFVLESERRTRLYVKIPITNYVIIKPNIPNKTFNSIWNPPSGQVLFHS